MNCCRLCNTELKYTLIDLKHSPVSNAFLKEQELDLPEVTFPLVVMICDNCFLVQTRDYQKSEELFTIDYPYFSSYSKSWLAHSKRFVEMMMQRFSFESQSLIVEIASNDGYLLQYFKSYDVEILGIEPTRSTAEVAIEKGIPTWVEFFGTDLAEEKFKLRKASLIIGNNVLAHVPDLNDFIQALKFTLSEDGLCTFEFPHLVELITNKQFDTIYHEHFSYFSFYAVQQAFLKHELEIFDVEKIPTHGGSIRIFVQHVQNGPHSVSPAVSSLLEEELQMGMNSLDCYSGFEIHAKKIKLDFLQFLIDAQKQGKSVVGYGAAAKGNTLLNYCGIKNDLIRYCADANIHKQGMFMPGSHIPIVAPERIKTDMPDFVVLFPWNLAAELTAELGYIKEWGGKFVMAIPELSIS